MTDSPFHKVTMSWPTALHAATCNLAKIHRRSFTAEACVALDEHLAANGVAVEGHPSTQAPTQPLLQRIP